MDQHHFIILDTESKRSFDVKQYGVYVASEELALATPFTLNELEEVIRVLGSTSGNRMSLHKRSLTVVSVLA